MEQTIVLTLCQQTATCWHFFYPMDILKELEVLIPPLTSEEFKQLERNILEEGIRDPLVTWNGILVDGHNRYRIATEYDIDFVTVEKEFADMNAVKEWMINNQFGRRNLSNYQRSVLALELEDVFKEKAKEKQIRKPESVIIWIIAQSDADFFITGDRDFTEVQSLGNTLIISVSLFAELMMKYAGNGNTNQKNSGCCKVFSFMSIIFLRL